MDDVHDVSLGLIMHLEEEDITVGLAQASLALSLGRLIVPPERNLSPEEELDFTKAAVEWARLYFTPGGIVH